MKNMTPEMQKFDDFCNAIQGCGLAPMVDLLARNPGGGYSLELYVAYAEELRAELEPAYHLKADLMLEPWRKKLKERKEELRRQEKFKNEHSRTNR